MKSALGCEDEGTERGFGADGLISVSRLNSIRLGVANPGVFPVLLSSSHEEVMGYFIGGHCECFASTECRYVKGEWSECMETSQPETSHSETSHSEKSHSKVRTDTLKPGSNASCENQREIIRRCKKNRRNGSFYSMDLFR